jgi:type IV pilus assembly protein PilC
MKNENISISPKEKLAILSNLSTLLKAGIPILEAVSSLAEDSKGSQKKLIDSIGADLMQGKSLNSCFAKFPKIFDKISVSIIKAAEDAGTLDVTLEDLKANIKREIEFNDKIKEAMIYPALIMVVFGAISLMILTFVMPKISVVFGSMNMPLPLPTRIMIWLSNLLIQQTIPLTIGLVIIIALAVFIVKKARSQIINLITKFPVVSTLSKKIDITRFTRTLYLLLTSGIPINTALELTQNVVTRKDVKLAVKDLYDTVLSGKKISISFRSHKNIFPTIVIKIVEAGEKTGTLDQSMRDASEYMDYEVENALKAVTTMIEPLALVVVGLAVGGMIMSIISPIYGMIGNLGGGPGH